MITGAQIREARALLRWERLTLRNKTAISLAALIRAEATDAEPNITIAQAETIQRTLEAAGVEFTDGEPPGVRLREAP